MRYYPIYLDIKNRHCLVVGGGSVGTRKVMTLLECGAAVAVVSPAITRQLRELANNDVITLTQRPFQNSDLKGNFLVIGATDDRELNLQIHAEAERLGLLCNIADHPDASNFILPSIVSRGDLSIAISTSGNSPALAKKLRKNLEKQFGDEYATFLTLMGNVRKKLLAQNHEPEGHKKLFEQLINTEIIKKIKNHEEEDINKTLLEILGDGYVYEELMQAEG